MLGRGMLLQVVGGWLLLWHGRWHRIAIAAIVEQDQVPAHVAHDYSLSCGFSVNANIRGGIRIFKPV